MRVKICGITNATDAEAALDAGADLLGMVFYPRSPRYVETAAARVLARVARTLRPDAQLVGVFVNEPLARVCEIMAEVGLDLAQLHGQESPEMVRSLQGRAYKSIQAREPGEAEILLARYANAVGSFAPGFIVDAPPAKLPGGNGLLANWDVARGIAAQFPILLAGGLTVDNVAGAIAAVRPWGVDVSSGVERAPGQKDHERLRAFLAAVRHAEGVMA